MKAKVVAGLTAVAAVCASQALAQPAEPAPPAPAAQPAPAAAPASAAPEAAPPAPAAAPAAAAPAPPPPPPTGEAADLVSMLDNACLPLISGAKIKAVAKTAGLKHSRDSWMLKLEGEQQIVVQPPTVANPNVCILNVQFAPGQVQPLVDALAGWGQTRNPPMVVLDKGTKTQRGSVTVTTWAWSGDTAQTHEGLSFNAQSNPDGRPVEKNHDLGTVMFIKQARS